MSREFKISRNYYEKKVYIYKTESFIFEPGVTVLVGCNGAGKTTFLKEIEKQLKKNDEKVIFFRYDMERLERDSRMQWGNASVNEFYSWVACSEGEQIMVRLGTLAREIGGFVTKNPGSDIFVLLDGVDSGFSIDNIIELKDGLFRIILREFESKPNNIYIICSANSYEMAANEDCVNVITGKHIRFKSYSGYKKCILSTKRMKEKRY